jgi:hypothetical protein
MKLMLRNMQNLFNRWMEVKKCHNYLTLLKFDYDVGFKIFKII